MGVEKPTNVIKKNLLVVASVVKVMLSLVKKALMGRGVSIKSVERRLIRNNKSSIALTVLDCCLPRDSLGETSPL